MSMKPKSPAESQVMMTETVLPHHTNALGNIFGGTVMSWIDIAGAIAAGKHARMPVVTASVDALHFIAPIKLGHVVELRASVNATGKTSMEVGVRVDSENLLTGERFHNVSAFLTFVALGNDGKPTVVPAIEPKTEKEIQRNISEQASPRKTNWFCLSVYINLGWSSRRSGAWPGFNAS
ncbi:MAG: acyl-CoA thioesterase [Spirochaetia bacterium]|nr:acyl-CoA thioesterase [Spirochaetia bacterium]